MLGGSNKVVVPDKSETSAFPGVPVSRYVDITNFTTSFEYTTQILRRCAVCEIINFQRHHAVNTRRWSSVTHYVLLFVMLLTNRTTFIYFLVSVMTNCRNKMASNNYGATQIRSQAHKKHGGDGGDRKRKRTKRGREAMSVNVIHTANLNLNVTI